MESNKLKVCLNCGTIYLPDKGNLLYCSRECFRKYNGRKKNPPKISKKCRVCKETFLPDNSEQITCSPECNRIHNNLTMTNQKISRQKRKANKANWEKISTYMTEHNCQYAEAVRALDGSY